MIDELRTQALQERDDFGGLRRHSRYKRRSPTIAGARAGCLHDIERPLIDVELHERRADVQLAEIRQQIAQAKGGVDITRVQRGQQDLGHRAHSAPLPRRGKGR